MGAETGGIDGIEIVGHTWRRLRTPRPTPPRLHLECEASTNATSRGTPINPVGRVVLAFDQDKGSSSSTDNSESAPRRVEDAQPPRAPLDWRQPPKFGVALTTIIHNASPAEAILKCDRRTNCRILHPVFYEFHRATLPSVLQHNLLHAPNISSPPRRQHPHARPPASPITAPPRYPNWRCGAGRAGRGGGR